MSAAALALLRRCQSPRGFVASCESGVDGGLANYGNIWSRDGCITGLAALISGDAELIETFRRTLLTLGDHLGPSGQAPSNVGERVSYGGSAGRVDATPWFVLGVGLYGRLTGDDALFQRYAPALERAVALMRAWEFNDGGLMVVPLSGDWADEYILSGYVLYDQLVRLWALRELALAARRTGHTSVAEAELTRIEPALARFFPSPDRPTFLAATHAGRAYTVFDAFGTALACLMKLGDDDGRAAASTDALSRTVHGLVPAFDPPIRPGDRDWEDLVGAAGGDRLRNEPGHYHNGGAWPMVNGFVALAARLHGQPERADALLAAIQRVNAHPEHPFPEYISADGAPGGTQNQAWSAAGELLAACDPSRLLPPRP